MKNILIIGGKGYVGTRLCDELDENVVSVDANFFNSAPSKRKNIQIDYNQLDTNYLSDFSHIILLAGHSSVRMCDDISCSVYKNNVNNFVNLLNKLNSDQTLIYASSGSVYGNCKEKLATEQTKLDSPYNMYDLTKQMIDVYALTSKPSPRFFGLRLGTINGFSRTLRTDVMMNSMITTAWREKKVLLFNADTNRSIIGTTDLVRVIRCIISSNTANSGVYNVSSFTKTSGEMAQIVSNKTGVPIELVVPSEENKNSLNEKLVSSKYNFSLCCDKFKNDFSFEFEETANSIVDDLMDNINNMTFTSRNVEFKYE